MCDNSCRIEGAGTGLRLDLALAEFFPDLSLRGRRRLWDTHTVLVNGKARPCGFMVRQGDTLSLRPKVEDAVHAQHNPTPSLACPPTAPFPVPDSPPYVVAEQENLVFFYKPRALHTVALQDRGGPSLEAALPVLWQGQEGPLPQLVNRLDYGTSGIVVAARNAAGAELWRRMENAKLCEKRYIALLEGALPAPITVRRMLDTAQRRSSRILATESTDPLRHTRFTPLGLLPPAWGERPLSVVGCTIAKGARHQIRVHASHMAFPLWGDGLYGGGAEATKGEVSSDFFLHHGALCLPASRVLCVPPWLELLPEALAEAVRGWLCGTA